MLDHFRSRAPDGVGRGAANIGVTALATVFDYVDDGDESIKALSLILRAWDQGEETGVAPEMMAYAALFTALSDLVAIYGEDAVAELAQGLERRVRIGEFTMLDAASQTRQ